VGGCRPGDTLASLRGRFVLLDFWTFCCVNCLHVLDELRGLEERWADVLTVVGVHSPKFPHEAEPGAVEAAAARYGVTHPVVDDADMTTWQAYATRAWPTLVLIDPEGFIAARYAGEGHAHAIDALLRDLVPLWRVVASCGRSTRSPGGRSRWPARGRRGCGTGRSTRRGSPSPPRWHPTRTGCGWWTPARFRLRATAGTRAGRALRTGHPGHGHGPPSALLVDGPGTTSQLTREIRVDPAVGGGVLHVTASAASCDVAVADGAGVACHLHRQDWGMSVEVVEDADDKLRLVLGGAAP
jgi:thiol-disulfide isomerase/thioredoxin